MGLYRRRVAVERLNRDQFFDKLAEMDEAGLKKALWTLYWRGSASLRERIEVGSIHRCEMFDERRRRRVPTPTLC